MKRFIGLGLLLMALLSFFLTACESETVEVTRVVAEEKVIAEPPEIVEADEESQITQVATEVRVEQTDEAYDPAGAADLNIVGKSRVSLICCAASLICRSLSAWRVVFSKMLATSNAEDSCKLI